MLPGTRGPECPRCHSPHWWLRVHDLRYSALSAWLAAGYTPHAAARPAGHSTITLLSIYGHGLEEQDKAIARGADGLGLHQKGDMIRHGACPVGVGGGPVSFGHLPASRFHIEERRFIFLVASNSEAMFHLFVA
ncbi:MAG: hypothetical protein WCB85_13800 [Candidatus Dormiibacterota bacterium]